MFRKIVHTLALVTAGLFLCFVGAGMLVAALHASPAVTDAVFALCGIAGAVNMFNWAYRPVATAINMWFKKSS